MKIISKYILREQIDYFLLSMIILSTLFMSHQVYKIIDLILRKGAALFDILILILLSVPASFNFTLPMSILVSTLMALGRLSADTEIIALRACGIRMLTIIFPILLVGTVGSGLCLGTETFIVPAARYQAKKIIAALSEKNPALTFEEQKIIHFAGKTMYAEKIDKKHHTLYDFLLIDKEKDQKFIAEKATWTQQKNSALTLTLINGSFQGLNETGNLEIMDNMRYGRMTIDLQHTLQDTKKKLVTKSSDEMSFMELRRFLQINNINKKSLYINLYEKIVLPFSCLAFAILALPIGLTTRKTGKAGGIGFTILFVTFYYILFSLSKIIINNDILSAATGLWIPNLVITALGIFLFVRRIKTDL